jgi:hypothetical protein
MPEQTLTVRLIGDDESLRRAFTRSQGATQTWATKIQRSSKIAAFALGGGLVAALKVGLDEVSASQKVAAQTAATLKATGGAANVSARDVERLAGSISKLSGIDDEAVQSGANLILTFKNVRNEAGKNAAIFDRATKAAVDLSVAGFGSIESTSKTVGKALNDPVAGLSALSRAGVTFTEKQRQMIKQLVETGDRLGAQKIILREIEGQVGGSAKAYGQTLAGQLAKARLQFENLAGSLAEALVPALTSMAAQGAKVATFLSENKGLAKALVLAVGALAVTLGAVSVASKTYAAALAIAKAAQVAATAAQWALNVALSANPVGAIVVGVAALAAGLVLAWRRSETFRRIVSGALESVREVAGRMVAAMRAVLGFVRTHWKTIAVAISGPFAPLVVLATDAFGIRSALVGAFQAIRRAIATAIEAVVEVVKSAAAKVYADARAIGQAIRDGVLAGLGDIGAALWKKLKGALGGLVGRAKGLLGIASPSRVFEEMGRAIGQGLARGLERSTRGLEKPLEKQLDVLERAVRAARLRLPEVQAPKVPPLELQRGPLTATSGLNTRKVLAGLGLDPDVIRELRGRLSGFNTRGLALATAAAPAPTAGFGGVLGGILVESHVTVELDGERVGRAVTRSQQKTRRRNPPQKRGPNRGR